MAFEEGLFDYLSNHAGLSALVGSRIYPSVLPQDPTLPAVTYFRVSTPRERAFKRSLLPQGMFQLDCWATTYPDAKDVAEQVRLALDMYRGTMGTETVLVSIIVNERDLYDPETGYWHPLVEVEIWWEE